VFAELIADATRLSAAGFVKISLRGAVLEVNDIGIVRHLGRVRMAHGASERSAPASSTRPKSLRHRPTRLGRQLRRQAWSPATGLITGGETENGKAKAWWMLSWWS
jgi:hypothetical protein